MMKESIFKVPITFPSLMHSVVLLVSAASLLQLVHTQLARECKRLTTADLGGPISRGLSPGSEVGDAPSVTVIEINIVCEAQATNKDRYRFTSVVVSFNCSSFDSRVALCNNASTVHTMQFDLGCTNTDWSVNYLGSSSSFSTENPTATLSTGLDSQCAACVNPDHIYIILLDTSVSDDTHCEACRGCTEGMGRCTVFNNAPGEDCCNYFDEGICVGECPGTLVGGSDFECRCSVLSDDNGVITFSNNQETDSVATLTCNTGYEGTDTVVCTGTGWTNVPTCTPVQCPQLDSIENGELSLTNSNNFNSMATYTCNSWYLLEGDSSGTCMSDKTWSHIPPSCNLTVEFQLRNIGIILAVLALLFIVGVILVGSILGYIKRRRSYVMKSEPQKLTENPAYTGLEVLETGEHVYEIADTITPQNSVSTEPQNPVSEEPLYEYINATTLNIVMDTEHSYVSADELNTSANVAYGTHH